MDYITFQSSARDGKTIELAVVEEFDFEQKHYVAAALVEDDMINTDGVFLYRCRLQNGAPVFEKIHNSVEYRKVSEAYIEMEDEADEAGDTEEEKPGSGEQA